MRSLTPRSTARRQGSKFDRFSKHAAHFAGHSVAFVAAVALIVLWLVSGPLFGFSNTWQLVINTATTIVTFLMVFVIQNTQNRDGAAMQIKLDELVRAVEGAHNGLLDLEELNEHEIEAFRKKYCELARKARDDIRHEKLDTNTPEIQLPA
jgi:low affinity Fe/Cu permease